MDDQQYDNDISLLLVFIICVLYLTLGLGLTIYSVKELLQKKNMFPILERSPTTTIFATISLYISTLGIQVASVRVYLLGDVNAFNDQTSNLLMVFGEIMFYQFFLFQLFKIARLVFVVHYPDPLIITILKRELKLCIIILITILAASGILIPLMIYKGAFEDEDRFIDNFYSYEIYPCVIEAFLIGVSTFLLRSLQTSYQLVSECCLLSIYLEILAINIQLSQYLDDTVSYVILHQIFDIVFFFLFLFNSIWHPLNLAKPYYDQMTPKMTCERLRFFLKEKKTLQVFADYLEYLDTSQKTKLTEDQIKETLCLLHSQTFQQLNGTGSESRKFKVLPNFSRLQWQADESQVQDQSKMELSTKLKKSFHIQMDEPNSEPYFYCNLLCFYLDIIQESIKNGGQLTYQASLSLIHEYFLGSGPLKYDSSNSSWIHRSESDRILNVQVVDEVEDVQRERLNSEQLNKRISDIMKTGTQDETVNLVIQFFNTIEKYLDQIFEEGYKKTYSYRVIHQKKVRHEQITINFSRLNMTYYQVKAEKDWQSVASDYDSII